MIDSTNPTPPRLNRTQKAWLHELGVSRQLLSHFQRDVPSLAAISSATKVLVPFTDRKLTAAPSAAPTITPINKAKANSLVSAAALLKGGQLNTAIPSEWAELAAYIEACERCSLHAGRSQTVFGSGAINSAQWMVIGEAPGDRDDRLGLPFQGKAGELLRAMLAAIGVMPDSSVFYTNLLKCRPRGNRTPEPEEIAACLPYLQRQISLLKPKRILTLGWLAAQALLANQADFEQLRGQVHLLTSETGAQIPLVATYHPASLLSCPQHKENAWRDLILARDALDVT